MIPFLPSLTPIGLDIGSQWVKAVQLRVSAGRPPRLAAAARFPRIARTDAIDPSEVERIVGVLARQGFSGRDVVITPPVSQQITAAIRLPSADAGAPLDLLAAAQLAEANRCEPDQIQSCWWPLPVPVAPGTAGPALAFGARTRDLESAIDQVEAGGLQVVACDVEACALARSCGPLLPDAPAVSCLLHMGHRACDLSVLCGRTLVYQRLLADAGVGSLLASLCKHLQVEPEIAGYILSDIGFAESPGTEPTEPGAGVPPTPTQHADRSWELGQDAREILARALDGLAQEIRVSLSYTASTFPASESAALHLVGGGAMIPGFARALAPRVELSVRRLDLRQLAACPSSRTPLAADASLAVACGLALDCPAGARVLQRSPLAASASTIGGAP